MRFSLPKNALAKGLSLAAAAAMTLTLGACNTGAEAEKAPGSAASTQWPRTITHEAGETVINSKPENIVSTTLSVTGTLLAIDAPVTASAVTAAKPGATDNNGFFEQWADVAVERGVEPLYTLPEFDLEAVIASDPDLIVVSTSGADSVLDQYDALSDIAPTIVVNYGDQPWQDLAVELGEATGLEAQAAEAVATFDAKVEETAKNLTIGDGATASVVSYNPGDTSPVGKTTGAHARLLTGLGFTVNEPPAEFDTSAQKREDFSFASYEGLAESATGDYTFLISATEAKADAFKNDPTLANIPSVQKDQVFALGLASFRMDPYSATDIVDWFGKTFAKQDAAAAE